MGGLAAVLAAGVSWMVWKRRHRQARRRNAYEVARVRLDRLLARPWPQDAAAIDGFFVEISVDRAPLSGGPV